MSTIATRPSQNTRRAEPSASGCRVICVSRHAGAGAHEVARFAAERLRYRLIDEDIATKAALAAGVEREVVADLERGRSTLVRLIEGFGAAGMGIAGMGIGYGELGAGERRGGQPPSDELRGLIRSVIEEAADRGNTVILAHAASLALARRGDVLRVLVTASESTRARRLAAELGADAKSAARALKRSDAARCEYIRRFYGLARELPTHYDLVLNTDRLTPEAGARVIALAASTRAGLPERGAEAV
jgi:cytidylate kinase